jgi:ATP-binding cassette subfamily B protein
MKDSDIYDSKVIRRILRLAMPYKSVFGITLVLTFALAFISPVRPWLIQKTLDDYIIALDSDGLNRMILFLVLILIIETAMQFFQTYWSNWLAQSVIRDLRINVYRKIIGFKLKYFDKSSVGTLVTRSVSDIEVIANVFSQGFLAIAGDLLKLIVILIVMFWTDWRLTLICLSTIPILLYATYIFKNAVKKAYQEVRNQVSKLNSFVQERIVGMNIIQIFGREQRELNNFNEINTEHRNAHIKSVWAYSIFFPIVELLSAVSLALIVWWGTAGVLDNSISFGNLVAFILYVYMMFRPIRQLADRFNTLQMGIVSSERVFKILDLEESIEDTGLTTLDNIQGHLEIKDLWFAYDKEDWVIKNLNLDVKAGEKLAIVGATGAGKTSLISVLGRFYEYQKGTILIDGNEIRNVDLENLRQHIGVVPQDVFLFSDTIYNNIVLGDHRISKEMIMKSASEVGIAEYIQGLPGGLDYNVRERGGVLSSGQRQLIAFLRAYLYNPEILVLDEATSSIDSESEELLQLATDHLTKSRTSIIIAHRLATIEGADRVIVMDKGRIVESGSPLELLKLDGYFKKLYDMQVE